MRCDAKWFAGLFLVPQTPPSLGPADDVWQWVKGFNEYDGLT
eukprot:gene13325-15423_t